MLFRLDENADSLWLNTYSDPAGDCSGIYFQQTSDDGFILLGEIKDGKTIMLLQYVKLNNLL